MRLRLLVILAVVLMSVASVLAGNRLNAKWESLFDGKTLDGWEVKNGKALYEVKDGVIVGTSVKGEPNSFLSTKQTYSNFILEVEFLADPAMNSGIMVRGLSTDEYRNGRVHGYQVEIDPSERAWTGGIYDEARRGWLYDLRHNEAARNAFKQNEWNLLHIEAIGSSLRTWLNGVPCANLQDAMTAEGFISLQVHSRPESGIQVQFRNIRILDLGTTTEFPQWLEGHSQ
jgi:hypothetical protein